MKDLPVTILDGERKIVGNSTPLDAKASESTESLHVQRDEEGRVTEVSHSTGKATKFEYDKQSGEMTGFAENEQHWTRNPDGTYTRDGSLETRSDLQVDAETGIVSYRNEEGEQVSNHPDGHTVRNRSDGSSIVTNPEGRLEAIHYPSTAGQSGPSTRTFEYDKETGEMSGFTEKNRDHWTKSGANTYTRDGSRPADVRTNVRLDPETGKFSYRNPDSSLPTDVHRPQGINNTVRGSEFSEMPDRTKVEHAGDGSKRVRDPEGRLESIQYPPRSDQPDPSVRTFEYDKATGEMSGFTEKNGEHWSRSPDGTYSKDGSQPPEIRSDVKVDAGGSFSYANAAGERVSNYPDGRTRRDRSDGSHVDTDPEGRVYSISYPSHPGETGRVFRSFEYYDEKGGKITSFTENQQRWTNDGEGTYNRDGSVPAERRSDVKIDPESGTFSYNDAEGRHVKAWPDGHIETQNPDGSSTITNPEGRITYIKQPPQPGETRGTTRGFEYDKQTGDLIGFIEDGESWTRNPDGTFTKLGSQPPETRSNVKMDADGRFSYKDASGAWVTIYPDNGRYVGHPDGTWEAYSPDGRLTMHGKREYDADGHLTRQTTVFEDNSVVEEDGSGRVVKATGPDGRSREFKYDDNGELSEIEGHLGTWKRTVDENGKVAWKNQDTGAIWNGDFRIDSVGWLWYDSHKGQDYLFPRDKGHVKLKSS